MAARIIRVADVLRRVVIFCIVVLMGSMSSSALHYFDGKLEKFEQHMDNGVDPKYRGWCNRTALFAGSDRKYWDSIKVLGTMLVDENLVKTETYDIEKVSNITQANLNYLMAWSALWIIEQNKKAGLLPDLKGAIVEAMKKVGQQRPRLKSKENLDYGVALDDVEKYLSAVLPPLQQETASVAATSREAWQPMQQQPSLEDQRYQALVDQLSFSNTWQTNPTQGDLNGLMVLGGLALIRSEVDKIPYGPSLSQDVVKRIVDSAKMGATRYKFDNCPWMLFELLPGKQAEIRAASTFADRFFSDRAVVEMLYDARCGRLEGVAAAPTEGPGVPKTESQHNHSLPGNLRNEGNTCFADSSLHALWSVPSFRNVIDNMSGYSQVARAVQERFDGKGRHDDMMAAIGYKKGEELRDYRQHDAAEFIRKLLDCLPSNISSLFKIEKDSGWRCSLCGRAKSTDSEYDCTTMFEVDREASQHRELDLKTELQNAIDDKKEEYIEGKRCSECKRAGGYYLRMGFKQYPQILMVSLPEHQVAGIPGPAVYSKPVHYKERMLVRDSGGEKNYVLKSMTCHSGTADAGHYISLFRWQDGAWYYANDLRSQVEKIVSPEDWFKQNSNFFPTILFYEKVQ